METKKDLKLFIGPRNSGKTTSCVVESYFTGAPILTMSNKCSIVNRAKELKLDQTPKVIGLNGFDLSKIIQGENIIVDDAIYLLNFLLRRHYEFRGTISAASITTNDV